MTNPNALFSKMMMTICLNAAPGVDVTSGFRAEVRRSYIAWHEVGRVFCGFGSWKCSYRLAPNGFAEQHQDKNIRTNTSFLFMVKPSIQIRLKGERRQPQNVSLSKRFPCVSKPEVVYTARPTGWSSAPSPVIQRPAVRKAPAVTILPRKGTRG